MSVDETVEGVAEVLFDGVIGKLFEQDGRKIADTLNKTTSFNLLCKNLANISSAYIDILT